MRLAIIGSTGLVGEELLSILEGSSLRNVQLLLAASSSKPNRTQLYGKTPHPVRDIESVLEQKPDIAIFSAGADVSRAWAPHFIEQNCWVIDNSSAWRMHPKCPLVVPEINSHLIAKNGSKPSIIANPNCATIQLAVALEPLHRHFTLEEVTISTYQAVSGAGATALQQLQSEQRGEIPSKRPLLHNIHDNLIPQIGLLHEGHSEEEQKIQEELRKILTLPRLPVHATCVRVPLLRGHSESVYIRTKKPIDSSSATDVLCAKSDLIVHKKDYPTPKEVAKSDPVHIGRIRQDKDDPQGLQLWIVADNLRKGAATNALQIATKLLSKKLLTQENKTSDSQKTTHPQ